MSSSSSPQTKDHVKSVLTLDVVVRESTVILQYISGKDQTLLIRGDSLLILNLVLDIGDGVRWLIIKSDGLTGEGLDKDLHWR